MATMQAQRQTPLVHQLRPRADDAHQYHVRVRGKVFLWGSEGITVDAKFTPAPVLQIFNDLFGEPITIGTRTASGVEKTLGILEPGQHFSVELHDICGVFASCSFESRVACAIDRV